VYDDSIPPQPPISVTPLEFRQKKEGINILLGSNTVGFPPVPAGATVSADLGRRVGMGTHEHPSQIQLIGTNDQIVLNIKFAPIFGMPPLELSNNKLSGLPSNWDCNHSARAIEIINETLVPIFHVYYKDDTHLVVAGVLTGKDETGNRVLFVSGDGVMSSLPGIDFSENEFFSKIEALGIKRLFKYPAWRHLGEYAE
jgi:hypothetical protein